MPSLLDMPQIIKAIYDEPNNRIRVDTGATFNISGELEIAIDAADGDNVAISDGTNTAAVNSNSQLEVHDADALTQLEQINQAYERFIPLLANANFLKVANYDTVSPTLIGDTIYLSYTEDTYEIAQVAFQFTDRYNWDLDIQRYILNDDGTKLLDDDDSFLLLE